MADGKLLHVEDDQDLRRFVGEALGAEGFCVEAASNGLEALKLLQQHPAAYALVILDLVLPWMNGLEVLAAVREHPATRLLPVLVTTGSMVTPGEFGGDPHVSVLRKPFDTQQLRVAVEQMLLTHGGR